MRLKKFLSSLIAVVMVFSLAVTPAFAKVFPDTDGHWSQDAVDNLSEYGVINGDDQGNYRPGDSITRAETATVLDNLIGYVTQSNKVFSDVAVTDWFAYSVSRLYAAGVMTGYEDGTIKPRNNISRQETAVMISRALGFKVEDADLSVLDRFADRDAIGEWAEYPVAFMAEQGYIQGSDGNFRATDAITRAEVAQIIDNIVGIYADGSQTAYSGDYGSKVAIIKSESQFDDINLGGAVISPKATGEIFFGNGAVINGCLYNVSSSAKVDYSGANILYTENATINASSSNTNSSTNTNTNTSGNRYSSSSSSGRGGSSGGSSSSSSKSTYKITFKANGGEFEDGSDSIRVSYTEGQKYRSKLPDDPERKGYEFAGWYTTKDGADKLSNSKEVDTTDYVSATKTLYAGWEGGEDVAGEGLDIAKGSDLYGKDADELMDDDMEIEIDEDDETLYYVSGTLKYVKEYVDYPGMVDEGNFLALSYTLPEDIEYPEEVKLTSKFGSNSSKEVYTDFDEDNLTYTRVFYVTEDDLETEITFDIDFNDEYNEDYENVEITVNIEDLELAEDKSVTETVDTEAEFADALADEDVTDIIIDEPIVLLSDATYAQVGAEKTITVKAPMTVEADGTVVLENLSFRTAAGSTVDALLNTAGATSVTLSGIKVNGAFTDVITIVDDAEVKIEKSEFKNTALVATAIAAAEAANSNVYTENTFEGYTIAIESNCTELVKENKFIDNTKDIKAINGNEESKVIPTYSYNYFDDAPVIDYDYAYRYEPYYTDEAMSTESDNNHDAFIFVTSKLTEEEEVLSLSETDFLALATDDELTIFALPKDERDSAVVITGGTAEGDVTDTVKVTAPGTALTVKVGEGAEKTVVVGHSSTEIKVYVSVTEENPTTEITAEDKNFSIDVSEMEVADTLYVKVVATDVTQEIKTLKSTEPELSYTANENGIFEIPVEDVKGDTNIEFSVETVCDALGEAVAYKLIIANE